MDNELMHYGVLGMKWGIRRYQNEDGSLTTEGKKHYANEAAYNIGKKATVAGYAAQKAQKRADKANAKLQKAEESGSLRKIEKAQARADIANRVNKELWDEYNDYVKQGEDHIKQLIDEYGEDQVQGFKYRENKSGNLSEPDRLVNERTFNAKDVAIAAGKSAVSTAIANLAGIPMVMIYTPATSKQQGSAAEKAKRVAVTREYAREKNGNAG